jgi:hypothetical protein
VAWCQVFSLTVIGLGQYGCVTSATNTNACLSSESLRTSNCFATIDCYRKLHYKLHVFCNIVLCPPGQQLWITCASYRSLHICILIYIYTYYMLHRQHPHVYTYKTLVCNMDDGIVDAYQALRNLTAALTSPKCLGTRAHLAQMGQDLCTQGTKLDQDM